MQSSGGRKRRISTCGPCYTRKQKCDRQYPCNHCTRRRRPEECVFGPPLTEAPSRRGSKGNDTVEVLPIVPDVSTQPLNVDSDGGSGMGAISGLAETATTHPDSVLAEAFGYFEHSSTNTRALLRNWDLNGISSPTRGHGMSPSTIEKLKRNFEQMPSREILDFLVQYHICELNWMEQAIHGPTFLARYQEWWATNDPLSVTDVEFSVLILRICAYAAHFLPSPTNNVDKIRGRSIVEILRTCDEVASSLASICASLDPKGSLVRVQHILYFSLKASCEGTWGQFWDGIISACSAALTAGIYTDASVQEYYGAQELEKEMNRRTFCVLYILDSVLSRQLDRVPILQDNLVAESLPRMRLATPLGDMDTDLNAPELFTERFLQVQLGRFWRNHTPDQKMPYDPTEAEQRYEEFISKFLPSLPPSFALHADKRWDAHLPQLAKQRQLLRITIFDTVCWNFRPLLLLTSDQVARLPTYKIVLLQAQKGRICMGALKVLEAVNTLHTLLGGHHTRFAAIIFNTFEAAILLLYLYSLPDFPSDLGEHDNDILGIQVGKVTPTTILQAVEKALSRLQMLAEVSPMAASGAQILAQFFSKATNPGTTQKYYETPNLPAISDAALSNVSWSNSMLVDPVVLGDMTGFWMDLSDDWQTKGIVELS